MSDNNVSDTDKICMQLFLDIQVCSQIMVVSFINEAYMSQMGGLIFVQVLQYIQADFLGVILVVRSYMFLFNFKGPFSWGQGKVGSMVLSLLKNCNQYWSQILVLHVLGHFR